MSVILDLLLIAISLLGFSFIISGKPRRRVSALRLRRNDIYLYRRDNFTLRFLKLVIFLSVLYFLGNLV